MTSAMASYGGNAINNVYSTFLNSWAKSLTDFKRVGTSEVGMGLQAA